MQTIGSIAAQKFDVGDSAKSVDVSGYFSEADGDPIVYAASSAAASVATASVSGSTLTITPVAAGSARVSVTADDGNGSTATQIIAVTVNRAPTKHGTLAAQTVKVGGSKAVDVSAGFDDPDGDALTYTASSADPTKATASVSGSTLSITGVAAGTATITVTASDGRLTVPQTFTATVGDNQAPTAVGSISAQTLGVATNPKPIDVSGNFSDADGDTLTYTASSSDETKATASVSSSTVSLTGVAAGTATITVTASDGAATATQTIAVTVTTNRAPTATTITAQTVGVGTNAKLIELSGKFSDADGDTLTYTASSSDKAKATVSVSGSTLSVTGVAVGSAAITVTASDGSLNVAQTFSVTVKTNNAPTRSGAFPNWTLRVPSSLTFDLGTKFSDPDGDTLTYTAASSNLEMVSLRISGSNLTVTAKRIGVVGATTSGNTGISVVASDGLLDSGSTGSVLDLTIIPRRNNKAVQKVGSIAARSVSATQSASVDVARYFSDADGDAMMYAASSADTAKLTTSVTGSTVTLTGVALGTAEITVTADDGQGSKATQKFDVTVTGNRAPIASASIPGQTVSVGSSSATLDLSGYFSDPDGDTLTYTATSGATRVATVSVSDSTLTLTGVATGTAPITVTASDGSLSGSQTVSVAVINNRAPTTVGTIATQTVTAGNSAKQIDLSGYFSDPDGDSLSYAASSSAVSNATVSVSNATLTLSGVAVGSSTVTVTASDSANLSAAQIFNVSVVTNQAPTAVGNIPALTIRVGTYAAETDVSSKFSDADGDALTYTASSSDNAKATVSVSSSTVGVTGVAVGSATITVTASDGALTATQTVAVTVQTNQAPVKVGTLDAQTLTTGKSGTDVDVGGGFNDPDGDRLTYAATSSAVSKATVSVSGSTVTIAPVAAGSATIDVTASDGAATSSKQPIAVTVFDNRPPVPVGSITAQTVTAGTNTAKTVDVKSAFSDPDGDALTYTVSSSDATKTKATVLGSKVSVRGIAAGSANIIVTASDGAATTSQSIAVTVTTNSAPTATGTISTQTVRVPNSVDVTVDTYFSDADGDPLTYTATNSHPARVGISVSGATVTITAKRAEHATSSDTTMTITASDGDLSATQTFTLTVQARSGNKPVTATGSIPAQTVDVAGSASSLDVSGYFSEPDGDTIHYAARSSAIAKATVGVSGSTLTITPVAGGTATIIVTADDGQGSSATQTIAVTVNRAPESAGAIPNQTITVATNPRPFDVSSYFSDPDGDALTYQAGSLKPSVVTVSASGSTVNLNGVTSGSATVAVTVSDGRLNFSQTFTVTAGSNRAPTAVGSIAGVSLGAGATAKTVDVSSNFSDADGDALTYTASSSDDAKATASVSGSTVSVSGAAAGSATITVTASDGAASATQTIAVTVTANRAPTTVGTISAMTVGVGTNPKPLDMSSYFSDADGDILSYNATSSHTSKVTVSVAGSTVEITGLALGSSTITLTASDGALSASRTFSVTAVSNRAPLKIGTMSWAPTVPDTTTVDVSPKFVDLDGDTLTYSATSSDASKATVSVSGSNVTMTAKRMGATTITITASDGGLSVSHQFTVTVKKRNPNQPVTTVGSISAYNFAHGDSAESLEVGSYFSEADGDAMVYTGSSSDDTIATVSLSGTTATITPVGPGRATLTVNADDGQDSSADQTIAVRVNRSVTASVTIPAQSLGAGKRATTVDLSDYFSDPDTGDTITYTASSSDTAKATATVSDSTLTLSGVAVTTNAITITVTASDGLTTATQTIAVTVVANRAPTLAASIPDITLRLQTHPRDIELSGYFTDPDGDTLTYTTWQSSNSQMALSVSGSTLTLTQKSTTLANTTMNIRVTASDGGATTVQDTFVVTVDYNTAPKRTGGLRTDYSLRVPNSLTRDLSTYFTDDDGDPLTYRVLSTTSSILGSATISGSQLTVKAERTGGVPSPKHGDVGYICDRQRWGGRRDQQQRPYMENNGVSTRQPDTWISQRGAPSEGHHPGRDSWALGLATPLTPVNTSPKRTGM